MPIAAKILLVEDDELVRSLIAERLKSANYQILLAGSGKEMFHVLNNSIVDMIILDLGLPDEDGIVLARKLKSRSNIPLIILTARDNREDRIAGLSVGADDYLTKSVDPEELFLRIRNLLNRTQGMSIKLPKSMTHNTIHFQGWVLDIDGFTLTDSQGNGVNLTPGEIKLLAVLAQNAKRVMSRGRLLDAISTKIDGPSDRMIDAFISRIRKKIEKKPGKPEIIVTITGVGYKFAAEID